MAFGILVGVSTLAMLGARSSGPGDGGDLQERLARLESWISAEESRRERASFLELRRI
jgi:hypothetical protein